MTSKLLKMQGFRKYQKNYAQDEVLFKEGEPGGDFYIIKDGEVEVSKEIDGENVVLASLGQGEVLGEMALIGDSSERSATVSAKTAVTCLKFSENQLQHLMKNSADFTARIMGFLCTRIRKTSEKLSQQKSNTQVMYKAALMLVHLIDSKEWYDSGSRNLGLELDIEQAAQHFAISPEYFKLFVSNTTKKEFEKLDDAVQQKAMETAIYVLKKGLGKFNFNSVYRTRTVEDEQFSDGLDVQETIDKAKELYTNVKNEEKTLKAEDLKKLSAAHKKIKDNPDTDPTDLELLNTYIKGLKKLVAEKKPSAYK